jgi:hypothetical protein
MAPLAPDAGRATPMMGRPKLRRTRTTPATLRVG